MSFKNKVQISLILCLITIAQSVNFCPTTGTTSNTIEQNVITQTIPLDYTYTSTTRNGLKFYETKASIANKTLSVQVTREDLTISIQTKTYTTTIEMIGIKNEVALIKVYSVDKSNFTINAIKYDFDNFDIDITEIFFQKIIVFPTQLNGFSIKKILTFVQQTQQMLVFVASTTEGAVYTISISDGTLSKVGTIISNTVPSLIGGFKGLIVDDTSDQFFTLASGVYTAVDATSITQGQDFYPTNVQIGHLERQTIGILSIDSASLKSILIISSAEGNDPTIFNAGAVSIKFYTDSISNILTFSDIKLVWYNIAFNPDNSFKAVIQSTSATIAENETLIDFSTGVSFYTSYQRAFVLSQYSLKIFKITQTQTIQKLQSVNLSSSMQNSLTEKYPKHVFLSFRCTCTVVSVQKLICFKLTLNCMALTSKSITDCTTTMQ